MSRSLKAGWLMLAGLVLLLGTQNGPHARSAEDSPDARLKKLLRDRVTLHQKVVDTYKSLGARGASRLETIRAEIGLLGAEFDASDTKDQRIAALTKIVALEKQIYQLSGNNESKFELLQNQIRWIESEIALEKEKLKTN